MKVLVVGQGGREHALAWKLARSESVTDVYCAPGNAGIAEDATCVDIAPADISALVSFAKDTPIDLTVVGPEAPLVDGLVDAFAEAGLSAFGPSAAAAALEGSKAYAKEIMHRGNVPTADSTVFEDIADARHFLQEREDQAWVVKADGLAAGKGVLMCATRIEALEAAEGMLVDDDFGPAGARILIEDSLVGEEASILALVDGNTIVSLEASQDHKRAGDEDTGPNTGGMGAYSPAPLVTADLLAEIEEKILINELAKNDKVDGSFVENLIKWADVIRKTFADGGVDEIISTRRLVHIIGAYSIFDSKMKAIEMCVSRFDTETKDSFLDLYTKVDAGVSVEDIMSEGSDDDSDDDEEEINF